MSKHNVQPLTTLIIVIFTFYNLYIYCVLPYHTQTETNDASLAFLQRLQQPLTRGYTSSEFKLL
jgi:hypothetical protein